VHFGVLSMPRNRTCFSRESCFSLENHDGALGQEPTAGDRHGSPASDRRTDDR
jgi:hypothetical protein